MPGVAGVHHVHAWSLTGDGALVMLHAALEEEAVAVAALHALQERLRATLGVEHATVQLERGGCTVSSC